MRHIKKIRVTVSGPPRIEFDSSIAAWYLRFKDTKIEKTLEVEGGPVIATVDFDARGEVVGVELIGLKELSLQIVHKLPGLDFSAMDLNKARFMTARNREKVPA